MAFPLPTGPEPSSVEESLRTLLEAFPGIVWTTDAELCWTAIFGADLGALGFAEQELLGRSVRDFLGGDPNREAAIEAHVRAVAGESGTYEITFGGQLRQGSVQPLRNRADEIVGTVGLSVNASEPQLAVRESEARTRAVINAALDAVVMIDGSGALLEFNPAAEAMFGYTRADVIGRQMVELIIPPSLRAAHREGFKRHLRTGESRILGRRLELSAVRADGTEFPVELTITRVRLGDNAVFAGYLRDLSEQRLLEEQLRQSQKMEAIGNLAGGIAHDFNNILMVIRSCAALTLGRNPDETIRQHVAQIDKAADRAARLTHQLLAFSRQQILRPEPTDINEIVTQTLTLIERLIGENIKTTASLDGDVESIVVDRGQLGQVILNLAVNARDSMPGGGTLSIRTANVVLDESYSTEHQEVEPGPYVMLQITDSGIGMDEATRARIFDPFFTTKDEGTGLGLATVWGVVTQSNGHIWVYSEPGHGSTFKLYFPATSASAPKPAPAPDVDSLEGSETILLAEDEAEVRSLIAKALGLYGYTVIEARNGVEALELADGQESIDLLLTDVVMPGMNGRELFEHMAERQPDLPVLFTSGYPADTVLRHGIAQGRVAYIEKPYLPSELARKIREVLDGVQLGQRGEG